MSEAAEEFVDTATTEFADQVEGAEQFVRSLTGLKVVYASLGAAIGAAVGGFVAFKIAYAKANTKYDQLAEEEISLMREHYQEKSLALEAKVAKKPLEEIVREQGYVSTEDEKSPMAVQPPVGIAEDAIPSDVVVRDEEHAEYVKGSESVADHEARMKRQAEAVAKDPQLRNVFEDNPPPDDHWDYNSELTRRSPLRPYVIHVDERAESVYVEATYTYYDIDDVLCNEGDEVIAPGTERETLVGEANLNLFGHGSLDANVVYIRNDRLEMDLEIIRSANSYAEEVHGFDPPEPELKHSDRRRGRLPFDDE